MQPCGTHAAYLRHRRASEEACGACQRAERDYQRSRTRRADRSDKPCEICGELMVLVEARRKFCSAPCRSKATVQSEAYARGQAKRNQSTRPKVQRECAHCGSAWMVDRHSKSRFCSISCAKTAEPSRRPKRPSKPKPAPMSQAELEALWRSQWSDLRRAREDGDHQAVIAAIKKKCSVTPDGCWEWPKVDKNGYPVATIGKKNVYVHRLILEAKHGAPLGSQAAHHICANPGCVSPNHLQPVTHRENVAEMLARKSYLSRIRELEMALAHVQPNHPLLATISVA